VSVTGRVRALTRVSVRPGNQGGFTLVEMLVSIFAGVILMLALFAVLDISTTQSARSIDRVESSQRGRTAMEQLVQELHSSCIAASVAPVLSSSDASTVKFISKFGSAPVLSPDQHVVTVQADGVKPYNDLVDKVYPATGGSSPNWTFSSTPSLTKTLAENVSQATVNGVTQPYFQYFSYANGNISTTPLTVPLSATNAASAVQVTVSMAVGPTDGSTDVRRTTNLNDAVVLRYIPAIGSTSVANLPCQ
jgi:prepilin-type N-terminal cleavage/methylation domain-containing protein